MVKRLNFVDDSSINNLNETLDLDRGNYKNALDLAINKTLSPPDFIKPGPYLGIVLRVEPTPSKDAPTALRSWWSRIYGVGSETEAPVPETLMAYKVRIPELDACIPEPTEYCNNIEQESEAQKYIEMHTTFWAKEAGTPQANPGDVVQVDFNDYKTREGPVFLGIPFGNPGQINLNAGDPSARPSAAYDKCADVSIEGAPDGSNLESTWDKFENGIRNWFIGEDDNIEQKQVESNEPKNTYPRECSTRTSTGLANEPDTDDEEENLIFLEEEVIPRLLPTLREIDGRFIVTSVYRSDDVNAAVGGNPSSYHAQGLGVDFGGLSGLSKEDRDGIMITAAKHLREKQSKFPWLRTVIVELWRNHIHVDVYPRKSGNTKWRIWKKEHLWENLS